MSNNSSPVRDDRIPVIVGVGEIADHPTELIVQKSEQFGLVMNSNGIMK